MTPMAHVARGGEGPRPDAPACPPGRPPPGRWEAAPPAWPRRTLTRTLWVCSSRYAASPTHNARLSTESGRAAHVPRGLRASRNLPPCKAERPWGLLAPAADLDLGHTFDLGGTSCQRLSLPSSTRNPERGFPAQPARGSLCPPAPLRGRARSDPRQPRAVDDAPSVMLHARNPEHAAYAAGWVCALGVLGGQSHQGLNVRPGSTPICHTLLHFAVSPN